MTKQKWVFSYRLGKVVPLDFISDSDDLYTEDDVHDSEKEAINARLLYYNNTIAYSQYQRDLFLKNHGYGKIRRWIASFKNEFQKKIRELENEHD